MAERRHRMSREQRLLSARDRNWVEDNRSSRDDTWTGKRLAHRYKKEYGVDLVCAIIELRELGVEVDEEYERQVRQSLHGQNDSRSEREEQAEQETVPDSDRARGFGSHHIRFVVGYTSGGAPYGLTDEQVEEMEDDLEEEDGIEDTPF